MSSFETTRSSGRELLLNARLPRVGILHRVAVAKALFNYRNDVRRGSEPEEDSFVRLIDKLAVHGCKAAPIFVSWINGDKGLTKKAALAIRILEGLIPRLEDEGLARSLIRRVAQQKITMYSDLYWELERFTKAADGTLQDRKKNPCEACARFSVAPET